MVETFLTRLLRSWRIRPSDDLNAPLQNDPVEVAVSLSKKTGDLFEEVGRENDGLSEEANALSKKLLDVHEYLGRVKRHPDPDPRIQDRALDLLH